MAATAAGGTAEALSLWEGMPPEEALVEPDPTLTIAERFDLFTQANPWVETALVRLARDLKNRGRQRIGMKMLFEVLRWEYQRATLDPTSDFRLNNDFTALYSRRLMDRYPELDGLFATRALASERSAA